MKKIYFPQHGGINTEQNLIQDLVDEQIKLFGSDVYYIPKKITESNSIDNIIHSDYQQYYMIEMLFVNIEGFGSPSDFISKFGLKITDEIKFVVSKRRWQQSISPNLNLKVSERPNEGDLIYFPLTKGLYEIKYVEKRTPFYQLGDNYFYTISAEIYELGEDKFDTGMDDIDKIEAEKSYVTTLTLSSLRVSATALPIMSNGFVVDFNIINIGKLYNVPPQITITPTNGGSGAEAKANVVNGSIVEIFSTNFGSGYISPPSVIIQAPPMPLDFIVGEHIVAGSFIERGNDRSWSSNNEKIYVNRLPGYDNNFVNTTQIKYFYWKFEDTRLNYIYTFKGINETNIAGEFYYEITNNRYVINAYLSTTTNGVLGKMFELSANVIAEVADWNGVSKELKIMNKTNNFLNTDIIRGVNSNAIWNIEDLNNLDNKNSNVDQNKYIEEEADLVIDWQEINPFGEYGNIGDVV